MLEPLKVFTYVNANTLWIFSLTQACLVLAHIQHLWIIPHGYKLHQGLLYQLILLLLIEGWLAGSSISLIHVPTLPMMCNNLVNACLTLPTLTIRLLFVCYATLRAHQVPASSLLLPEPLNFELLVTRIGQGVVTPGDQSLGSLFTSVLPVALSLFWCSSGCAFAILVVVP